jgi:hypothetical protein
MKGMHKLKSKIIIYHSTNLLALFFSCCLLTKWQQIRSKGWWYDSAIIVNKQNGHILSFKYLDVDVSSQIFTRILSSAEKDSIFILRSSFVSYTLIYNMSPMKWQLFKSEMYSSNYLKFRSESSELMTGRWFKNMHFFILHSTTNQLVT